MPIVPLGYPLDLTANAPTNLISNELVNFPDANSRIFVPSKGPFYTTTMELRHGVTNALLQPELQYRILQPVKEAIDMSGKEVCSVIYITDASVPSARLTYQIIGGIFADTANVIADLIANNPVPPSDTIYWWHIFGAPNQFTPTEHLHHVDNIYGMDDVVEVLDHIRIAISAGDSVAIGAIYQYIHTLLANLNYATLNQVIDLIPSSSIQYVRTYKTYADLRAVSSLVNNESYLYIATGKNAVNDGKGHIFMWDITCTIPDDGEFVIRPDHIPNDTLPGRFISALMLEKKLKALVATLGRKFDANGEVSGDLAVHHALDAIDLDTVITPNEYYYKNNCPNRPPVNGEYGLMKVWRETSTIVYQLVHTSENWLYVRYRDGLGVWSTWRRFASIDEVNAFVNTINAVLARHGIDSAIAAVNSISSIYDLDLTLISGKYWFTDQQANIPFDYGILEVEIVGGSIASPAEVHQRAYWDGREASRSRNYLGVWSPWYYYKTKNLAEERSLAYLDLDNATIPDDYYYHISTANRPTDYGLVRVRRESDGEIYQEAHSSDNRFFTRRRTAGGYWSPWREFADLNGNSSTRFKVAAAVFNDEAVRLEQLTNAVNTAVKKPWVYVADIAGGNYYDFVLQPYKTIRVCLIGGGGEGGLQSPGGYEVVGTHGEDTFLSTQDESTKFVIAQGGRRGQGGWYVYQGGARGADGRVYMARGYYGSILLYPCDIETAPAAVPPNAGIGGNGASPIANHNGGGRGGDGKFITAEFTNIGFAPFALRLRAGNQVGTNGGDGHTIGNAGYAVLYIEP